MATKAPLSTFAETPEDQKIVQEYRNQQKMLMDSLVNRKQLFDPTLLAIAQGLLSPTKTGSFGEALANAAGMAAPVIQQEEKRAQEIAKMRFDMAQQNLQMNRKDQVARMLAPPQAGAPAEAPTAGAPAGVPAGTPTGGAPATPAAGGAGTPAVPKPAAPARFGHITPDLAFEVGLRDPDAGKQAMQYLEAVNAQRKLEQDAFRANERGTTQIDPSLPGGFKYTPYPGRPLVNRFLPGTGNVDLTEQDAEKFDNVRDVLSRTPDDQAAQAELSRIVSKYRGAPKAGAAAPSTPVDVELEKKRRETQLLSDMKSDAERKEELINKSVLASNRLPSLSSLEQFALSPEAGKLLGVFEGSTLGQAIAQMVEPTMPQIRAAFTQYGLPEGVKANQGFVLQQIATINAEMRKILRAPGEGAQSDMENRMALAAGLEKQDTPGALVKKVRFLKAQAEFQRDLGRDFDKSKMTPTEFLMSNRYDGLLQTYEKKLGRVLGLSPQQVRSSAPKPAGNYSPAAAKLREELNATPKVP
jgi:hypothetical protein